MYQLSVACFAKDFLRTAFRVRGHDFESTFTAGALCQMPGIPVAHAVFVPLIRMFGWKRDMVFYVENKFLVDDLEGFFGDLTLDDTREHGIDILLCCLIADDLLVILFYRER